MEWREEPLHGQQPLVQDQPKVDEEAFNLWRRRGVLFPETEGFIEAIQNKVIGTGDCQKHILRHSVALMAAECWLKESIHRHNEVCEIIDQ